MLRERSSYKGSPTPGFTAARTRDTLLPHTSNIFETIAVSTLELAMDTGNTSTLLSVIQPWPIVSTLAVFLPAGDLINLSRTNSSFRAALHGFDPPPIAHDQELPFQTTVRATLRIGSHETLYWKQLKQIAPFLCASSTHTRGSNPRPCRYCQTPICQACIVRDSFAKRSEHTFKNRCRFLCKSCWNVGKPHRRCRFVDEPARRMREMSDGTTTPKSLQTNLESLDFVRPPGQDDSLRYNFTPEAGAFCTCTNKDDGWVCPPCKAMQNTEASVIETCFGVSCNEPLEEDRDRRRICLWCDRPMVRGRASMESRLAFDQKIQDSRSRRDTSQEDHTLKRQKLYKMSRRELRGDEEVMADPKADIPQFVRHLDTVNYQRYMRRSNTPSGDEVYHSKLGRWTYSRDFLLAFQSRCAKLPEHENVRNATRTDAPLQRTNLEKLNEGILILTKRCERGHNAPHLLESTSKQATEDCSARNSSKGKDDEDFKFASTLQAEEDRIMAEQLDLELNSGPFDSGRLFEADQEYGTDEVDELSTDTTQAESIDEGKQPQLTIHDRDTADGDGELENWQLLHTRPQPDHDQQPEGEMPKSQASEVLPPSEVATDGRPPAYSP